LFRPSLFEIEDGLCKASKSENTPVVKLSSQSLPKLKQLSADDANEEDESFSSDSEYISPIEKSRRQATPNDSRKKSLNENLESGKEELKFPTWDKSQKRWRKEYDKVAYKMLHEEAKKIGISKDELFKNVSLSNSFASIKK
jgi:hypothetical protein